MIYILSSTIKGIITKLKTFHCEIINDHQQLGIESIMYKGLPIVTNLPAYTVADNFRKIKQEIVELVDNEIERILNTPGLESLVK